jgi:hypothetical protein
VLATRKIRSYEHTRSAMPETGTRNREPGRPPVPDTAFGIEDPYSIRQASPEPSPLGTTGASPAAKTLFTLSKTRDQMSDARCQNTGIEQ